MQNLELLDSRAEQASRSDRSDSNLWESERLQKADAAAARKSEGSAGGGGAGAAAAAASGGSGVYQSPESVEQQARKKEAEDKWWSAEPDVPKGDNVASGAGGEQVAAGKGGEGSWWDEDGGEGGGSKGVDADSLPSFFDD